MLIIAPGQRIGTRQAGDAAPAASTADLAEWARIGVLIEVPDPPEGAPAGTITIEAAQALIARATEPPASDPKILASERRGPHATVRRRGR